MLEEKVQRLEENRYQELYETQLDPDYVYKKLVHVEGRFRRCNFRKGGAQWTRDESDEEHEEAVQTVLKEKLGLDNIIMERAHRVNKKIHRNSQGSRTAVLSFNLTSTRKKCRKKTSKLKGTNIFINECLSYEIIV